ncbi:MAG: DNA mismatch repair protein MutS [Clostridiales bacterium]|nr:DNA mismatch repair protein MutS [Clostridiales bacterium]
MKVSVSGKRMTVDIHGMRVEQARFRLESLLESGNAAIAEMLIIHGYKGGQKLKEMVSELNSPAIKEIRPSALNQGQTLLYLHKRK